MTLRAYQVILTQNLGPLGTGTSLDVTTHVMEVGPWQRQCEKELTKVAPSEQSIVLEDADGSLWAWIIEHLPSADWGSHPELGHANVYPLIVSLFINDVTTFTGFAAARQISYNEKSRVITIAAVDWSYQLANKPLGAINPEDDLDPTKNPWARPWPKAATTAVSGTHSCKLLAKSATPQGYDKIFFQQSGTTLWCSVGQMVTTDLHSLYSAFPAGVKYKVRSVQRNTTLPGSNWWEAQLTGFGDDVWDTIHQNTTLVITATFTAEAAGSATVDHFTCKQTIVKDAKGRYELTLDTVDGIQPGDKLETIDQTEQLSYTIQGVDGSRMCVRCVEEVENVTADVTKFWWDKDSLGQLVMTDAKEMITLAVTCQTEGYGVNFDRYVPTILPNSVFQWIPLRVAGKPDLSTITDIEADLSSVKIFGALGFNWTGSPEAGWTETTDQSKWTTWTDQLLSAPASLMPWEQIEIAPSARRRNKHIFTATTDVYSADPNLEDRRWRFDDEGNDPEPSQSLIYDYQLMRRIFLGTDTGGFYRIKIRYWSGGAWGTESDDAWIYGDPASACVVPGHPYCIAVLKTNGDVIVVNTNTGVETSPAPTSVDAGRIAEMVSTPYGVYIVGGNGYGKVTYNGSSVTATWVTLSNANALYPASFCAINSDEVVCCARFGAVNTDGAYESATYLLQLSGTPVDAKTSLLSSEKIADFFPFTLGAVRDNTTSGRVLGHCGGRLFSVSKTFGNSYTIERFTPGGMKAMELIEFICQIIGAIAVPDPLGTLHIISRDQAPTPIALTVDRIEQTTTHTWENFYSLVRVSSIKDESILMDVMGVQGGDVLEISQHPMIWTQSGCRALAQTLCNFFGKPRRSRSEKWFHTNVATASPWENLLPLQVVRINLESTAWMIMTINDDRFKGEADVTLVEVYT